MCNLFVRVFRDEDEPSIVRLFNNVYREYGGYVPRTVEYWRWCCLERPDVEKNGVFLAFDGEELRGYVVAGSSGNLWEFCVADGDKPAAGALLNAAMNYLENIGVSVVEVNVPTGTEIVDVLRENGFGEVPAAKMFITSLNLVTLFQELLTLRKQVILKSFNDEFGLRLRDVPYGVEKEFFVKIQDSSIDVVEGFQAEPSVVIELGFMDMLSILFDGSSAGRMFVTGRIRVKPFWKFREVLRLLSVISLRNPWFFPLSDFI